MAKDEKKPESLPEFEVFVRLMKLCGYSIDDTLAIYGIFRLMLHPWTEQELKDLETRE